MSPGRRKQYKIEGRHHNDDWEDQCSQAAAANCPFSRTASSAIKAQWELDREYIYDDRCNQAAAAHLFPHGRKLRTRTEWESEDMIVEITGTINVVKRQRVDVPSITRREGGDIGNDRRS